MKLDLNVFQMVLGPYSGHSGTWYIKDDQWESSLFLNCSTVLASTTDAGSEFQSLTARTANDEQRALDVALGFLIFHG